MKRLAQYRFVAAMLAALALVTAAKANQVATLPASPVAGKYQMQQAGQRLMALSDADRGRFQSLLNQARSLEEKGYLIKAMAVGHEMDRIETFANNIRGRDKTWLRNNLHFANKTNSQGIKQQWNDACGPATTLALFSELDPIFALRLAQADIAEAQKRLLEKPYPSGAKAGVAVPRGEKTGRGRWAEDLINSEKKATGLTYSYREIKGTYTIDRALADLDNALAMGIPVPVVAKATSGSHYGLVLSNKTVNGQKSYIIHDPWTGITVVRTEGQFREGRMELSGNQTFAGVSVPAW